MTDTIEITVRPLEASDATRMFQGLRDHRIYTCIDEQPPADLDALRARYEVLIYTCIDEQPPADLDALRARYESSAKGHLQILLRSGSTGSSWMTPRMNR